MIVLPLVSPLVATPPLDVMAAIEGLDELQVTSGVTLSVLLSALFPMAVNATWVPPPARELAGVTVIVAGSKSTVKVSADEVTEPMLAEMVVTPPVKPVASPVALMLATAGLEELHKATDVMSFMVPSE
jgi:hypothetical protein